MSEHTHQYHKPSVGQYGYATCDLCMNALRRYVANPPASDFERDVTEAERRSLQDRRRQTLAAGESSAIHVAHFSVSKVGYPPAKQDRKGKGHRRVS